MEELIPIVFFSCVAGVLILRPLTKRLGLLLEALAKERIARTTAPAPAAARMEPPQLDRVTVALEQLNSRLDLMEDRMGFVERLVESRPGPRQLTG